jgi:hypothetical protein
MVGSVARNDPTDTGGLFIGRRPGTAPLRYRADPKRGGERRRRADAVLAGLVLALETLLCLSVWGLQTAGWLWIGSQVDYAVDSTMTGIAVAFFGILATAMLTLALAVRLDRIWRLLRRGQRRDVRAAAGGQRLPGSHRGAAARRDRRRARRRARARGGRPRRGRVGARRAAHAGRR